MQLEFIINFSYCEHRVRISFISFIKQNIRVIIFYFGIHMDKYNMYIRCKFHADLFINAAVMQAGRE